MVGCDLIVDEIIIHCGEEYEGELQLCDECREKVAKK